MEERSAEVRDEIAALQQFVARCLINGSVDGDRWVELLSSSSDQAVIAIAARLHNQDGFRRPPTSPAPDGRSAHSAQSFARQIRDRRNAARPSYAISEALRESARMVLDARLNGRTLAEMDRSAPHSWSGSSGARRGWVTSRSRSQSWPLLSRCSLRTARPASRAARRSASSAPRRRLDCGACPPTSR